MDLPPAEAQAVFGCVRGRKRAVVTGASDRRIRDVRAGGAVCAVVVVGGGDRLNKVINLLAAEADRYILGLSSISLAK
jgi:hypothetical protein